MKKLFLRFIIVIFIFFLGFLASSLFFGTFQSKILPKSENKIMSWGQVSFKIPNGWKERNLQELMGEQQVVFENPDGINLIFVGMAAVPKNKQSLQSNFLEQYVYKGPTDRKNLPLEEVYLAGELGVKTPVETTQDFNTGKELTVNGFYVLSPDRKKVYSFYRTTTASDGASIRIGGWALEELISTVRFN